MTHYYAKYNNSVITGATNFLKVTLIKGKDTCSFTLPNNYNEHYETWLGRMNQEVIVYTSSDDSVIFRGVIKRVQNDNPLQIHLVSEVDRMTWYTIPDNSGNTIIDEVQLSNDPTDLPAYYTGSGTWTTNNLYTIRDTNTYFSDHADVYCLHEATSYVQRTGLDDAEGYFEFYLAVATTSVDNDFTIYVEDSAGNDIVRLHDDVGGGNAGDLMCTTGDGTTSIQDLGEDRTFYHIKIYYSVDTTGLIDDVVSVWVDGNLEVDGETSISNNHNKMDKLRFTNDDAFDIYIDAPAYDADSGYDVGDNLVASYGDIKCVTGDEDSIDPGWSTDQWTIDKEPVRYALISDNTFTTQSVNFVRSGAWSGNEDSTEGAQADTETDNDQSWELLKDDPTGFAGYLPITINGSTIPKTNYITSVGVTIKGATGCTFNLNVKEWIRLHIYWSKNSVFSSSEAILLKSVTGYQGAFLAGGYRKSTFACMSDYHIWHLSKEDNDDEKWFSKGAVNWEGGYLHFRVEDENKNPVSMGLKIFYAQIVVGYNTNDAEAVNRKIYSTFNESDGDIIALSNDDEDGVYDLSTSGFSPLDNCLIGIGMGEAFNRCFTSTRNLTLPILFLNNGEEIKKGVAQDFGVVKGFDLFTELCELNDFIYFCEYDATRTILNALQPSDIAAATITYSHASDPPSKWGGTGEPNNYGYVRIQYKNGVTPLIQADTPSSSEIEYFETRKDIITEEGAIEYGKKLANRMNNLQQSVQLEWHYEPTNIPQVGTKYDITLDKWNGSSFTTYAYSDYICRTVTISQDGTSGGQFSCSAEFGLLSTSGNEWIGKQIADAHNKIKRDIALSMTNRYVGVTRHGGLTGIAGDPEAYHIGATEFGYLDGITETPQTAAQIDTSISEDIATHAGDDDAHHAKYTDAEAVTAMGPKGDANALNHDKYELPTYVSEAALPYGETNAQWFPCTPAYPDNDDAIRMNTSTLENTGSTNFKMYYKLPKMCDTTTYKLIVDGVRIGVYDADGSAYITNIRVQRVKYDTLDTHWTDGNNYNTQAESDLDFTADGNNTGDMDCEGYRNVYVQLEIVCDANAEFNCIDPSLHMWYEEKT